MSAVARWNVLHPLGTGTLIQVVPASVYDDAVIALLGIVHAAVEHGVNDQVAEAIAHAEVVMGTRLGRGS